MFHCINCTLCNKLNEKKLYDFFIKHVCSAKTVDCFRILSRRKWLMQQNYDNLQARTETLIQHCLSVSWHRIWKYIPTIYTNTQIKASENLVPSNCTGLILVVEVMAENHHGYHEVIYLGCPVEQTTFRSWITQYRTQLNFTTPKDNIFWTNGRYFSASSPNTHKYLLAYPYPYKISYSPQPWPDTCDSTTLQCHKLKDHNIGWYKTPHPCKLEHVCHHHCSNCWTAKYFIFIKHINIKYGTPFTGHHLHLW